MISDDQSLVKILHIWLHLFSDEDNMIEFEKVDRLIYLVEHSRYPIIRYNALVLLSKLIHCDRVQRYFYEKEILNIIIQVLYHDEEDVVEPCIEILLVVCQEEIFLQQVIIFGIKDVLFGLLNSGALSPKTYGVTSQLLLNLTNTSLKNQFIPAIQKSLHLGHLVSYLNQQKGVQDVAQFYLMYIISQDHTRLTQFKDSETSVLLKYINSYWSLKICSNLFTSPKILKVLLSQASNFSKISESSREALFECFLKILNFFPKYVGSFSLEEYLPITKSPNTTLCISAIEIVGCILINSGLQEQEYLTKLKQIVPFLLEIYSSDNLEVLYSLSNTLSFICRRDETIYQELIRTIAQKISSFFLGTWILKCNDMFCFTVLDALKMNFLINKNPYEVTHVVGFTCRLLEKVFDNRFTESILILFGFLTESESFQDDFLVFDGLESLYQIVNSGESTTKVLCFKILTNLTKRKIIHTKLSESTILDDILKSISMDMNQNLIIASLEFLSEITENEMISIYIVKKGYINHVLKNINLDDQVILGIFSIILVNLTKYVENKNIISENQIILDLVIKMKTKSRFIKSNFAKTIINLSTDEKVRGKFSNSDLVPSIEILTEDEDENLSRLALHLMNKFTKRRSTLSELTLKKDLLKKEYLVPFELAIVDMVGDFKINLDWTWFDSISDELQHEYLHLCKISLWGVMRQSLEAFWAKYQNTFEQVSCLTIAMNTKSKIKFDGIGLIWTIGQDKMSVSQFLLQIETIFRLLKKEDEEIITKLVKKEPLDALRTCLIENFSFETLKVIFNLKSFYVMNKLFHQTISDCIAELKLENVIKTWNVKIWDQNQIKYDKFAILTKSHLYLLKVDMIKYVLDTRDVVQIDLTSLLLLEKGTIANYAKTHVFSVYSNMESKSIPFLKNVTPTRKVLRNDQIIEFKSFRPDVENRRTFHFVSQESIFLNEVMTAIYSVSKLISPHLVKPLDDQVFEMQQESYLVSLMPKFMKGLF